MVFFKPFIGEKNNLKSKQKSDGNFYIALDNNNETGNLYIDYNGKRN